MVWLGVRLIAQDRAQESRQLQDRRETVCARLIASLDQALASTERSLTNPLGQLPAPSEDAVFVVLRADGIEAPPPPKQRLLYSPVVPPDQAEPLALFADGEQIEFGIQDYGRAAKTFHALAASGPMSVRAGALLREARNLRNMGNPERALHVYSDLANLGGARIDGIPADLTARRARCALLEKLGRSDELHAEARSLSQDLLSARWQLDRGAWLNYAAEVQGWLGSEWHPPTERGALSEAATWLWQEQAPSGRRALAFNGVNVTVLWQSGGGHIAALVAGPAFQRKEWFQSLQYDRKEYRVALTGEGGQPFYGARSADSAATRRAPAETGLPWTISVSNADAAADLAGFAYRRRMLQSGLVILVALVIVGGSFTLRAVSREFAVARLQSDFVSSVSHEFRTPLTSLRQFTDLLSEDDNLPAEKRRSFYQAQTRATERLQRLVESLLDFGRMEAGAHPYRRERLDAAQLVRGVVDDFQREVAAQGFTVECALEQVCGAIDADPDALTRALRNLLDNAVKYSGASRTVWVCLFGESGSIAVSVRDQGIGIPRGEQAEIFRKFVRGNEARAQGIKGTGIGLAMVRHIVEGHGGTVRLESVPGEGSTFTILLPGRA